MTTQYSKRSAIEALTSTEAAAIADATVKSSTANERWLYSSTATDAASSGLVIVPSDNPTSGRWLRQVDYSAVAAIISMLESSGSTDSSSSSSGSSASVSEELAEFAAQQKALEDAKNQIAQQQSAADEALANANALIAQVAALVACAQQDSAISSQQTTSSLSAQMTTAARSLSAAITKTATAAASATKAVAEDVVDLTAALEGYTNAGAVSAEFEEIKTAYVSADEALTKRTATLESELSGMDDSEGSVRAAIEDAATAYVTTTDALSERLDTQEAIIGNSSSSATLQIDTSTSSSVAAAIATATLVATDGTNTATVGFEGDAVVEDGTVVSQWKFIADRVVFSPDDVSDATAYIDVTNARIVFDSGTYMLVEGTGFGASGQFALWFGPTQSAISACSASNAVFYLATDGSGYFGGSLSAGTLTTKAATSSTSSSASIETAEFGSNGGTITVTLSYSYLASQTATYSTKSAWLAAVEALDLTESSSTLYTGSGDDATTYVDLYRATSGGDYASDAVTTLELSGSYSVYAEYSSDTGGTITYTDKISGSKTYTDPATSAVDRQYEAVLRTRGATYTYGITQTLSLICVEE